MEKATEKQINFMRNLKIPEETIQMMSIAGAKDLISAKLAERDAGKPQEFGRPDIVAKATTMIVPKEMSEEDRQRFAQSQSQYNPTSMYVSYAKDIFIALSETLDVIKEKDKVIESCDYLMKLSINLVKQAHKEFS